MLRIKDRAEPKVVVIYSRLVEIKKKTLENMSAKRRFGSPSVSFDGLFRSPFGHGSLFRFSLNI